VRQLHQCAARKWTRTVTSLLLLLLSISPDSEWHLVAATTAMIMILSSFSCCHHYYQQQLLLLQTQQHPHYDISSQVSARMRACVCARMRASLRACVNVCARRESILVASSHSLSPPPMSGFWPLPVTVAVTSPNSRRRRRRRMAWSPRPRRRGRRPPGEALQARGQLASGSITAVAGWYDDMKSARPTGIRVK
jgi:hypothetical protein